MSKLIDAIMCKNLPARDIRNANIVNLWAIGWAANLAVISFISKYEWYSATLPIAVAFGGYSILDKAGVAPELQASSLIVLIALTYMAGIIVGRTRYR